jgi:hypothetical protein
LQRGELRVQSLLLFSPYFERRFHEEVDGCITYAGDGIFHAVDRLQEGRAEKGFFSDSTREAKHWPYHSPVVSVGGVDAG